MLAFKCENPACDRTLVGHKWDKIRAHATGWYFMKDGRIFCPDHRPEWAPKHAREVQELQPLPPVMRLHRHRAVPGARQHRPLPMALVPGFRRGNVQREG